MRPTPNPGRTAARPRFYIDRNLGKLAEDAVARALARLTGRPVHHSNGRDHRADLQVGKSRIEVKADLRAHRTGRVAVELARDERPSGVATSGAETVVIVMPPSSTARMLPRAALLAMADVAPRRRGGDGQRTTVALVPIPLLMRHSAALELDAEDARRLATAAAERGRRP